MKCPPKTIYALKCGFVSHFYSYLIFFVGLLPYILDFVFFYGITGRS